jgi:hypothetical protein
LRRTFRPFFLSGHRRRRLFNDLRGLAMPIGPATTWARASCDIADVELAWAISLIGYHTHELALATRRQDQKKERERAGYFSMPIP